MPTGALAGAADYFAQVLRPNKEMFFNRPSTLQNALNLAASLYHFHEWLYIDFQAKLEKEFGRRFENKQVFWQAVEAKNPHFGYIRDVANFSKHVKIDKSHKPSTGMTHIANTVIVTT